jgi:hypothetical protein
MVMKIFSVHEKQNGSRTAVRACGNDLEPAVQVHFGTLAT